ncbi:hypothetical protein AB6M11_002579 [Listeria monocytogenes]|nr:hypothetical protein [Listeria monocytogenes]EFQ5017902.1 hypothetical protein [Listeria monocytogenes]EHD1579068.1 hypothetical protein [Listeria monocytogenes]HAK1572560.1 hypothetical protein [Listeria monocytogenes]
MDLSDFLNSGWEGVLVVLGIVGVLINFLSKAGKTDEAEAKKAQKPRPKIRTTHQVSRTQTTKKPAKRKVSQGTFAQSKTQDKVIAEQKATQEKMLREIRRESDVAKGKKLIKSTSNHSKKARKLRGRLQEAIITKEILDKPVSLRKNHL